MDEGLEEFLQAKVNMVAEIIIKECPEIAKNDPKRIGRMAKVIVFDAMDKAITEFNRLQKI